MLYLRAWLIVPEGDFDGIDLRRFFDENRRRFLVPYFASVAGGVLINSTLAAFQDLVSPAVVLWFLPGIAAWIWPHRWVQVAALAVTWGLGVAYAMGNIAAL